MEAKVWQKVFLQNLSGKESLIGKSISLMKVVGNDMPDELIDCCVIGEDMLPMHLQKGHKKFQPPVLPAPEHPAPAKPSPYQPYRAAPAYVAPVESYVVDYGYGGYGGVAKKNN